MMATAVSSETFHAENGITITTKDAITVQQTFNYLRDNLEKFRVGSQFLVVSGVHGSDQGQLLQGDEALVRDYRMMFRWFNHKKKYSEQVKVVEERQYHMGTVLEVYSKLDESQEDGKYVLEDHSKGEIKAKVEELLSIQKPIVFILASCWSYRSEIFSILQASGLLAVVNLLEDRGQITNGNMLFLDPEQQQFIRRLSDETLETKDTIGMNE